MSARPPLVSADYPHAIHMANGAFLDRFFCGRQEVLGQPLHFFSSINSESFDGVLTPPCDAWSALLAIALDGRIARSRRNTSDDVGIQICGNAADEVTYSPVLRQTAPSATSSSALAPRPALAVRMCALSTAVTLLIPTQQLIALLARQHCQDVAWGPDFFPRLPRLRSLGPAIFPRSMPSLQVQEHAMITYSPHS